MFRTTVLLALAARSTGSHGASSTTTETPILAILHGKVHVPRGKPGNHLSITLAERAAQTGWIMDSQGQPLAEFPVDCSVGRGSLQRAYTDTFGRFRVSNLPSRVAVSVGPHRGMPTEIPKLEPGEVRDVGILRAEPLHAVTPLFRITELGCGSAEMEE